MPMPRPPRGSDLEQGDDTSTGQSPAGSRVDNSSVAVDEFTVADFEFQTEDFGAPDIADAFSQLPIEDVQAASTTRAVALLDFLRRRCATTVPKPGSRGGKARDILRRLRDNPEELIPDIDPPDDLLPAPTSEDVRTRRVLFPTVEERLPAPPPPAAAATRGTSALRTALETGLPTFSGPEPPSCSAAPAPVPGNTASVASPDLVRLGASFALQVQRQAQGSVSLFVGARQWQSVRNRREAETWAFVLDELIKLYGWGISGTMAFEAAARRLAALSEVDQGEEWSTMADVELIPAGTVLLPDAIRKAMMNRAKVESTRGKKDKQRGGKPGADTSTTR